LFPLEDAKERARSKGKSDRWLRGHGPRYRPRRLCNR
jgi:hypothetical protein